MSIHELRPYDDRYKSNESFDLSATHNEGIWTPVYGEYSYEKQMQKLDALHRSVWPLVSDKDDLHLAVNDTAQFIGQSFSLYDGETRPEYDGSFAFVVPTRISRKSPEYSEEAINHFPILKYVDPATRQRMLVGMCPFVIDNYGVDENGRRGSMVFTPLFEDMLTDMAGDPKLLSVFSKVINDTALFVRDRLGSDSIGLGAILPKLTNMGNAINVDGVHTTTGHGGTVHLIVETMRSVIERSLVDNYMGRIGIVGAGSIASASADAILTGGLADHLMLSDNKPERLSKTLAALRNAHPNALIEGTLDNRDVFTHSKLIISAITSVLDLDKPEWDKVDFDGVFIGDDSQPGCFRPEQVEERGGRLAWYIGRDASDRGVATLDSFSYGSTGPASREDIWGCQAEVAAISLTGNKDAAIKGEVTPEKALRIGELFKHIPVTLAPFQRMGEYLDTNEPNLKIIDQS